MSYNGWKNRETWNVALWLTNDRALYKTSKQILSGEGCEGKPNNYQEFAENLVSVGCEETPDGVGFLCPELDHKELWEMLEELKEE